MKLLSGQRAWLLQRLTAVYAGVYTLIAIVVFIFWSPPDHATWQALVGHPVVALASAAFVVLMLLHAWVGLRDVILDYLRPASVRLSALALAGTGFLVLGLWALWILLEAAR